MSAPNRLKYDEYMRGWLRGCCGDVVIFEKDPSFISGYEQGKKDRLRQISIASRLDADPGYDCEKD